MNDPYIELANAIIKQAADDYRRTLKKYVKNPERRAVRQEKKRLERFFHSDWFEILSYANPNRIIHELQDEVE